MIAEADPKHFCLLALAVKDCFGIRIESKLVNDALSKLRPLLSPEIKDLEFRHIPSCHCQKVPSIRRASRQPHAFRSWKVIELMGLQIEFMQRNSRLTA